MCKSHASNDKGVVTVQRPNKYAVEHYLITAQLDGTLIGLCYNSYSMFDKLNEDFMRSMVDEVSSKDQEEITAQIQGLDLSKNVKEGELTLIIDLKEQDTANINVRADSKSVKIYLPYSEDEELFVEPSYDDPDLFIKLEQPIDVTRAEATIENGALLVEAPLQDRVGVSLLNRNNTSEVKIN